MPEVDPYGMIVDRKSIETRLNALINEYNALQQKMQQLKIEQERTLDDLASHQGAIRELQKVLADNPVLNASSLQTIPK